MKNSTLQRIAAAAVFAVVTQVIPAAAVPINGLYVDDPRCDPLPTQALSHELGNTNVFPNNERILRAVAAINFTVCVPNDGNANDWLVEIRNVSGQPWNNLHFVCDKGVTVGNADGSAMDLGGAPGALTDAFRIDGTVTLGINNNLLGESFVNDEIFMPGELWRFAVSNFGALNTSGVFLPPNFITPGIFAGSSTFLSNPGNASILATPYVPEPATVSLVVLAAGALLLRRPRRA